MLQCMLTVVHMACSDWLPVGLIHIMHFIHINSWTVLGICPSLCSASQLILEAFYQAAINISQYKESMVHTCKEKYTVMQFLNRPASTC